MKSIVLIISVFLSLSLPAMSQETQQGTGTQGTQRSQIDNSINADDEGIELREDPRKAASARPIVVKPSGKECKDSLLRETNSMDIPNQGQFPNPDNPNGFNDGTLNNNNGELPQRMNCNAVNDITPRQESLDSPLFENSPVLKDPE